MNKEFARTLAGALVWLGAKTGFVRGKRIAEKAAFQDEVVPEANADVVSDRIPYIGSGLSKKERALREKLGRAADVHDAALLFHLESGKGVISGRDVPLGDTPREE